MAEDPIEQPKKKHNRSTLMILAVTFAAILCVSVFVRLFGANYTGFVSYDVNKVKIGESAYKGSEYLLASNQSLNAKSLRLSGSIFGNGSVKIYLNGNKLIYSNEKKQYQVSPITGFAVKDTSGSKLIGDLSQIKIDNSRLSNIKLTSYGNENGMYIEKVKVSWTPDNGEKIEGMMLNGFELWGYGKAGSPVGKQASGTELNGWGQKLPNNVPRTLDSIDFDSDMKDKEILIEIYFYDYLAGFRLGEERVLKIHLDLSGKKESYIEEEGKIRQSTFMIEVSNYQGGTGKPTNGTSTAGNNQGKNITGLDPGDYQLNEGNATTGTYSGEYKELYQGVSVDALPDGRVLKKMPIVSFNGTEGMENTAINIQIVEDPKYRKSFTENPTPGMKSFADACEDTCLMDDLILDSYNLTFEVDEGTAVNITDMQLS